MKPSKHRQEYLRDYLRHYRQINRDKQRRNHARMGIHYSRVTILGVRVNWKAGAQ